jgi:hypothetical protein
MALLMLLLQKKTIAAIMPFAIAGSWRIPTDPLILRGRATQKEHQD